MSGHSHWAVTKRQKAVVDAKRGQVFTKIANIITIAARDGGPDSVMNFKLRMAMEKARQVNMPKENIERAIKRGTGEAGGQIEEISYEAFGPGGTALIIELMTDNKNRSMNQLKHLLNQYDGSLANIGSVVWQFQRLGVIYLALDTQKRADWEQIELQLIEKGVEDIKTEGDKLVLYMKPENLQAVKGALEAADVAISDVALEMVPKEKITIADAATKQKLEELFNALDDWEEIKDFYSNADF